MEFDAGEFWIQKSGNLHIPSSLLNAIQNCEIYEHMYSVPVIQKL
jgi:hypothetical protein